MALKTWQLLVVFCNSAILAAVLLTGIIRLSGQLSPSQLMLLIHNFLACFTSCILVYTAQKRQIWFMALGLPIVHFLVCVAEVWHCPPISMIIQLSGALSILFGVTLMRKLASRLVAFGDKKKVKVTYVQCLIWLLMAGIIIFNFAVSIAGHIFIIIEAILWLLCLLNVWYHFALYVRHLNRTFGVFIKFVGRPANHVMESLNMRSESFRKKSTLKRLSSTVNESVQRISSKINSFATDPHLNTAEPSGEGFRLQPNAHEIVRAREANMTKAKLKKNLLCGLLVSCNLYTPYFMFKGTYFLGGGYGPGKCYLQGDEDVSAYEKVGSVLAVVGAIFVHLSWWHTIFIFRAANKKRVLMQTKARTSREGVVDDDNIQSSANPHTAQ
jgi:hypothetical protein